MEGSALKASAYKILAVLILIAFAFELRYFAANTLYIDYDEPVYLNNALEYTNFIRAGKWTWLAWDTTHYEHPAFYKIVYGVALLTQPPVDSLKSQILIRANSSKLPRPGPWGWLTGMYPYSSVQPPSWCWQS